MVASTTRHSILGGIRLLGYIVGVLAAAAGVAYAVFAATGDIQLGDRGLIHLAPPLVFLHAAAFVVGSLTVTGIALVVGDLARRIRSGVQFVPSVSRSVWALAAMLAGGSWLSQILETIATRSMSYCPDTCSSDIANVDKLPIDWSVGPLSFLPDGPLLGLAVVLAVLAYIVQSGERLQRDTDGLV